MDTMNIAGQEIPVVIDDLFSDMPAEERDRMLKELVYKVSSRGKIPATEEDNKRMDDFSANALAHAYLELRDRRAEIKKDFEAIDKKLEAQQDEISAAIIALCEKMGASTIRTESGTITRKTYTNYTTNDWGSLYSIINQYQAPYLLEKRIVKTAMESFLEEHPEAYPPGMQINSKYIISIRKPSN